MKLSVNRMNEAEVHFRASNQDVDWATNCNTSNASHITKWLCQVASQYDAGCYRKAPEPKLNELSWNCVVTTQVYERIKALTTNPPIIRQLTLSLNSGCCGSWCYHHVWCLRFWTQKAKIDTLWVWLLSNNLVRYRKVVKKFLVVYYNCCTFFFFSIKPFI